MAKSTLANFCKTGFIAVVFAGATCECVLLLLFLPPLPLQPLLVLLLLLLLLLPLSLMCLPQTLDGQEHSRQFL